MLRESALKPLVRCRRIDQRRAPSYKNRSVCVVQAVPHARWALSSAHRHVLPTE